MTKKELELKVRELTGYINAINKTMCHYKWEIWEALKEEDFEKASHIMKLLHQFKAMRTMFYNKIEETKNDVNEDIFNELLNKYLDEEEEMEDEEDGLY